MLFSSISFLYYFLPVVLVLYFAVPKPLKNIILFLSSLFFYFYGEPLYCLLMLFSILSGYLHGLWIGRARGTRYARVPLVSSIVIGIGALLFFKYADFFINNINTLFGLDIALLRLALPLGISFYTFQILSYTIDTYRGESRVQGSFLRFGTYVSLFPQLIAGPIVRYTTVENLLANRRHSFADTASGVSRFITGLAKKILIANTLGELGNTFLYLDDKTVLFYWLAAVGFMLQIYYDFSGYSDMAIGLGRIFGFRFPENFNYPYISKSITEFWRRWHISLGMWFRNYVYIPLGGNRVSTLKWVRNILVVWFLTGFWHGAEWNFIVWGLMFALLLLMEKWFLRDLLGKLPSPVGHFYVLLMVLLGFVLFNAGGLREGVENIRGMFGLLGIPLSSPESLYYFKSYLVVFLVAILGATPLPAKLVQNIRSRSRGEKWVNAMEPAALMLMFLLATGYLIDGSFNPFLYFRF